MAWEILHLFYEQTQSFSSCGCLLYFKRIPPFSLTRDFNKCCSACVTAVKSLPEHQYSVLTTFSGFGRLQGTYISTENLVTLKSLLGGIKVFQQISWYLIHRLSQTMSAVSKPWMFFILPKDPVFQIHCTVSKFSIFFFYKMPKHDS